MRYIIYHTLGDRSTFTMKSKFFTFLLFIVNFVCIFVFHLYCISVVICNSTHALSKQIR